MTQPSFIGDYRILKRIGRGAFSQVWLGEHRLTRYKVAIKEISKSMITSLEIENHLNREISIMKMINFPYIVKLFEHFTDAKAIYLVMEYVPNETLYDYLVKNGAIAENIAKKIFSQIILVLEYLHQTLHIAHRDIKPQNILLDRANNIRIIDFGLSAIFTDDDPFLKTPCGSPSFLPPEVIKGLSYTKNADIWSAGILLYLMVVGHLPFGEKSVELTYQKVVFADPSFPPSISHQIIDLILKLLKKNPDHRINIESIKQHPWLSESLLVDEFVSIKAIEYSKTIDEMILYKLESLKINCKGIQGQLDNNEYTELTSLYFQLMCEKRNEMMGDGVPSKIVQSNSYQIHNTRQNDLNFFGTKSSLFSDRRMSRPAIFRMPQMPRQAK